MNHSALCLKAAFVFILILFATTERLPALCLSSPQSLQSPSPACSAPEFRQFDFWLGDWDAFDADKPAATVARLKVDRILDGCAVHEDYQDTDGLKG